MYLIVIQLQKQSPPGFGRFPSVKDRIMTLAPMHPMFQVSIDSCDHSSPNLFGKSTLTWTSTCQAEVAIRAASKLQSQNCRIIVLEFESVCESAKIGVQLYSYLQIAIIVFVIGKLWRGFHCDKANFCEVTPKKKRKKERRKKEYIYRQPKWHLIGVEDFNIRTLLTSLHYLCYDVMLQDIIWW